MFKYYNPQGASKEDCVIRAILVCTGKKYATIRKELNQYKRITGAKSFNSHHNPHRYVEEVLGAQKVSVPKNTTVEQFCKQHKQGRFILDLPGHWVGVLGNETSEADYWDSWDCGKEPVYYAYEITTEPYIPPDPRDQIFRYCCTSEIIPHTETTRIRIYDGLGTFVERIIPTELTAGYVLCLQHSHYDYIELIGADV